MCIETHVTCNFNRSTSVACHYTVWREKRMTVFARIECDCFLLLIKCFLQQLTQQSIYSSRYRVPYQVHYVFVSHDNLKRKHTISDSGSERKPTEILAAHGVSTMFKRIKLERSLDEQDARFSNPG